MKNICERLLVNLAPYSQYLIVAFFNFEKYQKTLGQNWIIHNLWNFQKRTKILQTQFSSPTKTICLYPIRHISCFVYWLKSAIRPLHTCYSEIYKQQLIKPSLLIIWAGQLSFFFQIPRFLTIPIFFFFFCFFYVLFGNRLVRVVPMITKN